MTTALMLFLSNLFMTTAWYWHLRSGPRPMVAFIAFSWLVALPEYCLAVPANRIGHFSNGGPFTAPQLKMLQEAIALFVFLGFTVVVLKESPRWTDLAGAALILLGLAVSLWGRAL
jgi:uncharacterized protein (DUF486 family)